MGPCFHLCTVDTNKSFTQPTRCYHCVQRSSSIPPPREAAWAARVPAAATEEYPKPSSVTTVHGTVSASVVSPVYFTRPNTYDNALPCGKLWWKGVPEVRPKGPYSFKLLRNHRLCRPVPDVPPTSVMNSPCTHVRCFLAHVLLRVSVCCCEHLHAVEIVLGLPVGHSSELPP